MNKLLLLIFAFACISVKAVQDFKFYVFAAIWEGSLCTLDECEEQGISQFWDIHGLWPSDGNLGLGYCSDTPFDPNLIQHLKPQLSQYWNGLYSNGDSFHAHEWARHGTCSGMDQYTFFSTVLNLGLDLDIYGALVKGGIYPGNSYDCQDIGKAISTAYGVSNFSVLAPTGYLSEILLCLSPELKVQDCASSGICSGNVTYPARV